MSAFNVFELEADGFTHLRSCCPRCGEATLMTFDEVRARLPFVPVWSNTVAELEEHFICHICPAGTKLKLDALKGLRVRRGGPDLARRRGYS